MTPIIAHFFAIISPSATHMDTNTKLLFKCIAKNDENEAIALIKSGKCDLYAEIYWRTPLIHAIVNRVSENIILAIIKTKKFNINRTYGGITMLEDACCRINPRIARALLEIYLHDNIEIYRFNDVVQWSLNNNMYEILYILLTFDIKNCEQKCTNPRFVLYVSTAAYVPKCSLNDHIIKLRKILDECEIN